MTSRTAKGRIEVITGCMFSGKTDELIRRLRRTQIAGNKVAVYKPLIDTRSGNGEIVSHNGIRLPAIMINEPTELLRRSGKVSVIGIDEGQFFGDELVAVCRELADRKVRVIVAGLDMDFMGRPFGPMPLLMAVAERVTKLRAICVRCGRAANYSYRLIQAPETILIGAKDLYEARCRKCFLQNNQEANSFSSGLR